MLDCTAFWVRHKFVGDSSGRRYYKRAQRLVVAANPTYWISCIIPSSSKYVEGFSDWSRAELKWVWLSNPEEGCKASLIGEFQVKFFDLRARMSIFFKGRVCCSLCGGGKFVKNFR